jgi:formamidopyrimidine-DNA glycosylase
MPELPEVETTLRGIAPHWVGQRVEDVIVREPRLRWPVTHALTEIKGQRCVSASRRGKYLLFLMESGATVMMHLGMSGSLRVVPVSTPWRKHDHVAITLPEGQQLRLHDPRRFGAVLMIDGPPEEHALLCELGPEPLSDAFSAQHLFDSSRGKAAAVKTFIMDSHQVVGVGNIYACESLFMAGIHPEKPAGKVTLPRYAKLHAAICEVLSASIEMGGTTLRDFVRDTGEPGYFKQSLRVYDREGEPCRQCSSLVKRKVLGQRSTFYCGKCQR